jgi:phage head maturation protease
MNYIRRDEVAESLITRLLDLQPESYNETDSTVDAVLSRGSPVKRFYGIEKLEISKHAVDLSRMATCGIPILDSHQSTGISNSLGRVVSAWIRDDALMGTLRFNKTMEGALAEGMVARGEVSAVSIGYSTQDWRITDTKGNEVDPTSARWSDNDLTFTATGWTLVEASLCSVPADPSATMRKSGDRAYLQTEPSYLQDVRARMAARHNISTGTLAVDHYRGALPCELVPARSVFDVQQRGNLHLPRLVFYG